MHEPGRSRIHSSMCSEELCSPTQSLVPGKKERSLCSETPTLPMTTSTVPSDFSQRIARISSPSWSSESSKWRILYSGTMVIRLCWGRSASWPDWTFCYFLGSARLMVWRTQGSPNPLPWLLQVMGKNDTSLQDFSFHINRAASDAYRQREEAEFDWDVLKA